MMEVLAKLIKADHKDIQTQIEEFNREPRSTLNYKAKEEQYKVLRKPTVIYPVTL